MDTFNFIQAQFIIIKITKDQYVESYDIELKSDSLALFVWLQAYPIEVNICLIKIS